MTGYTPAQAQKQRPALALLFRNVAKNNATVLEPFIFRLMHSRHVPNVYLTCT
jgi:hypothetical protein